MINQLSKEATPPELAAFPWSAFPEGIVVAADTGTPTSKTICLVEGAAPEFALGMIQRKGQGHVLQKNALGLATELGFAAGFLADPMAFFKKPLQTIFHPVSTPMQAQGMAVLKNSGEKDAILQQFETFAKPWPIKQQLLTNALTVLDEMVTNACYNAPFAKQKQVVSRSLRVDLKAQEYANVFWGVSSEKIVVGCIDPFGALVIPDLLTRLIKSLQQGMDSTLNRGHGGAGIGFRMIVDYAASLLVAVQPGKYTAIVAAFPVGVAPKNALLDRKHLHFYLGK